MEPFFEDIQKVILSYYQDLVVLLPKLVLATIVFSILFTIANRSRSFVNRRLSERMDDPLLAKFLARLVKIAITLMALLFVLKIVGLSDIATGLITGASVSAIVVGFAFKDIGENFLSGIMLAFDRPFRVGDTVELDGQKGKVIALNLKNSQIKTFDGKDIYIPNASIIKNPVINYTIDGFLRHEFTLGIDYGSDTNKAIQIIREQLNSIKGIERNEKDPSVHISSLGASSLNVTAQYWLNTFDASISTAKIKTEAISKCLLALDEAGFYMPGDILELKNYNELPLAQSASSSSKIS